MYRGTGSSVDIVVALKGVLLLMNLRLQDPGRQCYDGAATMAYHKAGVATQIRPLTLFDMGFFEPSVMSGGGGA